MTHDELLREIEVLKIQAITVFTARAPHRSGTLKRAIRVEPSSEGWGFRIVLDIYYAGYGEEAWLCPKWGGRKNYNEGWFRRAFEFVLRYIESRLGVQFVKG
jgi:hypothetical protein